MSGDSTKFQSETKEREGVETQARRLRRTRVHSAGLGEIEGFLHTVESDPPAPPTLEQWTQFNERVMDRVGEAARRRRTFRERWQALRDRFHASDSRLKQYRWVAVVAVLLLGSCLLVYLAA